MSKLKYSKKSLFDSDCDVLVHACNSKGIWGSGIAAEFKKRFPNAFKEYQEFCQHKDSNEIVGFSCLTETDPQIGCLITSEYYGNKKDSPDEILIQTVLALEYMLGYFRYPSDYKFGSNKFNSGLFNVPWHKTETILKYFVKKYNLNWTVYLNEK